ncbi:MAG: P44/Msp2 family outer membrane protein, partial [Wolbachia endosymbiont of Melophagus ovinus]|nr:P44/Msp2 family outer membrane protein [Wolbachia endosymbiont of Melophagus ovinus]
MSNKKILAVTAFALLLSQQSFASETEGFYFGGGYYGQFFNSMSELKVGSGDKVTRASVNDVGHFSTKGQFLSKYQPNYNPLFAGNIAFGYTGELGDNSYRAELEGIYSSVKVDNIGLEGNRIGLSYLKQVKSQSAPGSNADKTYGYGVHVNNDKIENASVMA